MELDITLAQLLAHDATLMADVKKVGVGSVPPGEHNCYLVIYDVGTDPNYTMGGVEVTTDELYVISCYVLPGDSESAHTIAKRVLERVRVLLQNQNLNVSGRSLLRGIQGPRIPSAYEAIKSENQTYYKAGYKWWFTTAPA